MPRVVFEKATVKQVENYLLNTTHPNVADAAAICNNNRALVYNLARKHKVKLTKPSKPTLKKHLQLAEVIKENCHLSISELSKITKNKYHQIEYVVSLFGLSVKKRKINDRRKESIQENNKLFDWSAYGNGII